MDRGTATTGDAQDSRFVGGSQLVAQRLAEELDGRVHLSAPARRISQGSTGVTVVPDAGVWRADRVIVAVPPVLAARIVGPLGVLLNGIQEPGMRAAMRTSMTHLDRLLRAERSATAR